LEASGPAHLEGAVGLCEKEVEDCLVQAVLVRNERLDHAGRATLKVNLGSEASDRAHGIAVLLDLKEFDLVARLTLLPLELVSVSGGPEDSLAGRAVSAPLPRPARDVQGGDWVDVRGGVLVQCSSSQRTEAACYN